MYRRPESTMAAKLIMVFTCFSVAFCEIEEVGLARSFSLTDGNWTVMLEGEWIVKFYAPWCPACRHLEAAWESLAEWSVNKDFKVGGVDVTKESGLSGRFIITSLPTIYHVRNGVFRQYTESRTLEEFQSFMGDQKWKDVEPISQWKAPSSAIMSIISKLFEVSMQLKDWHTSLTETYGVPVWASFVIFGGLVIFFGFILGMGMVLASDYFFGPPCPPSYPMMAESQRKEQAAETNTMGEDESEDSGSEREENGVRIRKRNPPKSEE